MPEEAAATLSGIADDNAPSKQSTILWVVIMLALQTALGYCAESKLPSLTLTCIGLYAPAFGGNSGSNTAFKM